jgi:hypothetical protein
MTEPLEPVRRKPSNPRRDRDLAHLARLMAGQGLEEVEGLRQQPPPPALLQGVSQFNDGSFFDAHVTWEPLWRKAWYPGKLFYQGLIKAAVGQAHMKRGNPTGATSQSHDAMLLLQPFAPMCLAIDVGQLISGLEHFVGTLEVGADPPTLNVIVSQ